jgi:hypothetical protein
MNPLPEMMATPVLEPSFLVLNQHHIAHYRAYLPVGTFVVLQDELGVWRIVKFSDGLIVVNHFIPMRSAPLSVRRTIRQCTDVSIRHMTEVIQTEKLSSIEPESVVDIAFVFKEEEVRGGERGFCQGMTNAFILRYKIVVEDKQDVLQTVLDCHCLPFPSDYLEYRLLLSACFPSGIWRHVSAIQEELSRVLGRTAEAAQGIFTKKLIKISMDQSMWTYLCFKALDGGCCCPHTVNMSVFKRVTKPGMDLAKFVARHECKLLRFETQSDLKVLCSIFGESTIMNVRAKMPPRPKPNQPMNDRELNENDIINVINGEVQREDPFLRHTNRDGLDFVYDFKSGKASMYVRYTMYVYGSNRAHKSIVTERYIRRQRPLCLPVLDAAEEAARNELQVEIDSEFLHEGELFRVVELGAFGVHAECIIPPTALVRQFDEDYVRVQVEDRLT